MKRPPTLENLLLTAATLAALGGIVLYEAAADWRLPGHTRAALPLAAAVLVLGLLAYRRKLQRSTPPGGAPGAAAEGVTARSRAWAWNVALGAVFFAFAPSWLPWVRVSPLPLRARIVGSFLGVASCLALGALLWGRRRLPLRPAARILVFGGGLAAAAVAYDGAVLVQANALDRITREMNAANQARVSRGATRDALERYLDTLRRIDLGLAPDDFKGAYSAYVRALAGQMVSAELSDPAGARDDVERARLAQAKMVSVVARFQ